MPAIDPGGGRAKPVRIVKKKPAVKAPAKKAAPRVNVRPPDQADRSKTARAQQLKRSVPKTPDQADRKREPAVQAHDRQVTKRVVRESREKALRKRSRGSGTRLVKKLANRAATGIKAAAGNTGGSFGANEKTRNPVLGGGASATGQFAAIRPMPAASISAAEPGGRFAANAGKDTAEIVTGTIPATVHLAKTAVTDPEKVPGMLLEPYKNLLKDPGKEFFERPISSALMLQPVVRMPGRVAGRPARVTGKQSLERPDATLPGTSLKEKRTGSRDAVVRSKQSRDDRKAPAPKVTAKQVQRRVDEHYDYARQYVARAETKARQDATRQSKGRPKDERAQAIADAVEQAREKAHLEMDQQFAREFGANERLTEGGGQRETARALREATETQLKQDRKAAASAKRQHVKAKKDAKRAYKSTVTALEQARGARVTSGPRRGVPPAEHQQLVTALMNRDDTRSALARARTAVPAANAQLKTSRAEATAARSEHIAATQRMRAATLTDAASEGRLFDHAAEARAVAKRLNAAGTEIGRGGKLPARLTVHDETAARPVSAVRGRGTAPLEFGIRQVGEQWAVVPKLAQERLTQHQAVGSSKATMAKVARRSGDAFGQAVLPLSVKWLAGQAIEPAVRAVVAGAGPADFVRMKRTVRKMNAERPGAGDELALRLSSDRLQHLGLGDGVPDAPRAKSLAHEFESTWLEQPAAAATMAGHTAPARVIRKGWHAYTDKVIGSINAVLESTSRTAMAGQALKNSAHMERRINGLSDRAIADAAKGLKGTEAQVELARAVDRMYGQYQKFSPDKRSLIMHWARFLPWFLNAGTFLTRVLPVDHPVMTALLVDINTAAEEWRKDEGLSYRYGGEGSLPDFLLGSYPDGNGGFYRLAQFTPMGLGPDPGASISGLVLPQFQGAARNLAGFDWKGSKLRGRDGEDYNQSERALRALFSLGESHLPAVGKAGRITGFTERTIDQEDDEDIPPLRERLLRELPTTPVKSAGSSSATGPGPKVKPIKVKPVRVKPIKVKKIKVR